MKENQRASRDRKQEYSCAATVSYTHLDVYKRQDLAHQYGREFVFHRAFDCTVDFDAAMRQLIDWKVDRVLTSGGEAKAEQGIETIARLQRNYGSQIEILAGSGVNAGNAQLLLKQTGVCQLHSSCKDWLKMCIRDSASACLFLSFFNFKDFETGK